MFDDWGYGKGVAKIILDKSKVEIFDLSPVEKETGSPSLRQQDNRPHLCLFLFTT